MNLPKSTIVALAFFLWLSSPVLASTISFQSPPSLTLNEPEMIEIHVDSDSLITGVDIKLSYDPDTITVTKVLKSSQLPLDQFFQNIDESTGTITISASNISATTSAATGTLLANLEVIGTKTTSTTFGLDCRPGQTDDSNITTIVSTADTLDCSTISPFTIQVKLDNPNAIDTLTLHGRFYGLTPADSINIPSTINLGLVGQSKPLFTLTQNFTSVPEGYFVTTINPLPVELLQGQEYWLTVKGQSHLQRALEPIILSTNTPIVDFTKTPFMPGDISPQDGQLDNHDLNLILSQLIQPQPSDSLLYDLNQDGVINSLDLNLILNSTILTP